MNSQFRAGVPQVYADVDRDKALKQGVPVADVYQTLQAFLGGVYVNQFNRFGRQWRVFLQAEAEDRASPEDIGRFHVRNAGGEMLPLSTVVTPRHIVGPEYTQRFNLFRAAQITGQAAPGYSSGQAMAALEEVAQEVLPREMGYDWADLSTRSGTRRPAESSSHFLVFVFYLCLYILTLSALLYRRPLGDRQGPEAGRERDRGRAAIRAGGHGGQRQARSRAEPEPDQRRERGRGPGELTRWPASSSTARSSPS